MSKFTPGKWRIEEDFAVENLSDPTYLKIKSSHLICKLQVCDDADIRREQEANARLIAQSPRMYEALKQLIPITWNDGPLAKAYESIGKQAEEILAKVEGKE